MSLIHAGILTLPEFGAGTLDLLELRVAGFCGPGGDR